jgi:uncharacterized protein YndB with AHSA1/START domain
MDAEGVPPAGTSPERELVTSRLLAFPRERVFAAWIAGDRLARWWGPAGFTNVSEVFEPRAGGAWRFVMHGPDGARFPNESRFLELDPGGRIVVRHVSPPAFDLVVTLADEAGGTRLRWCQRFESAALADKMKDLAGPANEQNLDRLEAELGQG